jgi:hypothetical protein
MIGSLHRCVMSDHWMDGMSVPMELSCVWLWWERSEWVDGLWIDGHWLDGTAC